MYPDIGKLAVGPVQVEVTSLAPAASAPDRNGSTALMASTLPDLSAETMSGKGISTYFTAPTPRPFSTESVVSVWMFCVRLTATVLPASWDGLVMPEDGSAATP